MKFLLALLTIFAPIAAHAGSYLVIANQGGIPVSVSIDLPADYVGVSVTIRSDAKIAKDRLDEVSQTRAKLIQAVTRKPNLEIQWVKSSFSLNDGDSFSFSSSYSSDSDSSLYILGKLAKTNSVESLVREIITVVSSVRADGDASISTGSTILGITNPEQNRDRLLVLIKREIAKTKKSLGNIAETEVSGLEAPVAVTQKNDREVTLFIPYRMKAVQK